MMLSVFFFLSMVMIYSSQHGSTESKYTLATAFNIFIIGLSEINRCSLFADNTEYYRPQISPCNCSLL
jgi:hypothetical protein